MHGATIKIVTSYVGTSKGKETFAQFCFNVIKFETELVFQFKDILAIFQNFVTDFVLSQSN